MASTAPLPLGRQRLHIVTMRCVLRPRRRAASSSGQVEARACSCRSVSVAIWIDERRATRRVASASRSPTPRGTARSSRPSASRAARVASMSSVFFPIRRDGRFGLSISHTVSSAAINHAASPRPQLPQPSITQHRFPGCVSATDTSFANPEGSAVAVCVANFLPVAACKNAAVWVCL